MRLSLFPVPVGTVRSSRNRVSRFITWVSRQSRQQSAESPNWTGLFGEVKLMSFRDGCMVQTSSRDSSLGPAAFQLSGASTRPLLKDWEGAVVRLRELEASSMASLANL